MVAQSTALGCIKRCDDVGFNKVKCGCGVIAILQPKLLIGGITMHVIGVHEIKFDHEPTILKGSRVQRDGILKRNANKLPFTCGCIPDVVGNEE
jgi:hypothetical protein